LLQAYLLRSGTGNHQSQDSYQPNNYTELSTDEAYEILGLPSSATTDQVIKAHKRLMQRLHPDRGGSDYLAAKINAAKDKLI
jgi:DnaJ-class molecular chaperone